MEPNKIHSTLRIKLNTKRIPVLPPGSTYLMQSMMDESLNFRQLAGIVERYPSIAARLIALANSVWSSPVSPINVTGAGLFPTRIRCGQKHLYCPVGIIPIRPHPLPGLRC